MSEPVLVEVTANIGRVTLHRPEAMNAITVELGRQLDLALRDLGENADVDVILVRGAGGNFSAGGDFHEVQRLREGGPQALEPLFSHFASACRAVAAIPQPVVAAVEGVAMAGGFELMQACDVVLVHADARICDTHVVYGQVPGGGSTQRLPRLVGRQRAMAHLLSGDRLSAEDAVAWGLAHRALPGEVFDREVEAFVATLAGRRPDATRAIKRLVNEGLAGSLSDGLALEMATVIDHIAGEAGDAGVSTFAAKK
ncbi:enoyl-CoA hydratase/isomerase family protein [Nocardioides pantholopis]|uniref:enoyl-CoA hydratase/isomerase family protein n=1 Tax=Nocardioides pantholopis TaxID=2483798 RepID=UPI000FDB1F66|nr:enoyl-CoA hydratase/isomerase family protein [Nocardioides pantholopis]